MFYPLMIQPGNIFRIKDEVWTTAKYSISQQNDDLNSIGVLCELPPTKGHYAGAPLWAEKTEKTAAKIRWVLNNLNNFIIYGQQNT